MGLRPQTRRPLNSEINQKKAQIFLVEILHNRAD